MCSKGGHTAVSKANNDMGHSDSRVSGVLRKIMMLDPQQFYAVRLLPCHALDKYLILQLAKETYKLAHQAVGCTCHGPLLSRTATTSQNIRWTGHPLSSVDGKSQATLVTTATRDLENRHAESVVEPVGSLSLNPMRPDFTLTLWIVLRGELFSSAACDKVLTFVCVLSYDIACFANIIDNIANPSRHSEEA